MYVYIYIYIYTSVNLCIYIYMYIYIYTHKHTHISICVCIYIYIYTYTYICTYVRLEQGHAQVPEVARVSPADEVLQHYQLIWDQLILSTYMVSTNTINLYGIS